MSKKKIIEKEVLEKATMITKDFVDSIQTSRKLTDVYVLYGKNATEEVVIYGVFEDLENAINEYKLILQKEDTIYEPIIDHRWIVPTNPYNLENSYIKGYRLREQHKMNKKRTFKSKKPYVKKTYQEKIQKKRLKKISNGDKNE